MDHASKVSNVFILYKVLLTWEFSASHLLQNLHDKLVKLYSEKASLTLNLRDKLGKSRLMIDKTI